MTGQGDAVNKTFTPIDGQVIYLSWVKAIFYLFWNVIGIGVSLIAIYCFVTQRPIFDRLQVTFTGFGMAVAYLIGCSIFLVAFFRWFWRQHRLVIGDNCIQMQETRLAKSEVTLHLPFQLIRDVQCVKRFQGNILEITLKRTDDPATLAPRKRSIFWADEARLIYRIHGGYAMSLKKLAKSISEAIAAWKKR